jgi:hypothetical protein
MFTGRHHWANEKLFRVTKRFIEAKLGFKEPTDFETWALVLLLNPAKGIKESKRKDRELEPACPELYHTLGPEGLKIFREIFNNNNKTLIQAFFNHSIVRQLWSYIHSNLTEEHCFKRASLNQGIRLTFVHITQILQSDFKLAPPRWWL